jgi:hypothetical protein
MPAALDDPTTRHVPWLDGSIGVPGSSGQVATRSLYAMEGSADIVGTTYRIHHDLTLSLHEKNQGKGNCRP